MALTEQEQRIVKESKAHYFGAYLQWAWFEYPDLLKDAGEKKYPSQEELNFIKKRMDSKRKVFDFHYLEFLQDGNNPLKVEQEAWKLLSPLVRQHTDDFEVYIRDYSPQNVDQERLLSYLNTGWNLLQKWNLISKSYKAKHTQNWAEVEERENAVRNLIQELQQQSPKR